MISRKESHETKYQTPKVKKLVLLGGSGGNKGDLAILKSMISTLKKVFKDPDIVISTMIPRDLKKIEPGFNVIPSLFDRPDVCADMKVRQRTGYKYLLYSFVFFVVTSLQYFLLLISTLLVKLGLKSPYRAKVVEVFKEADLIILIGGEHFKEGSAFLPKHAFRKQMFGWWVNLFHRLLTFLVVTKLLKRKLIIFPNSVGPVRTILGNFMIRLMINCADTIFVRDSPSVCVLNKMGIKHFVKTIDIALLFEDNQLSHVEKLSKPVIGVCPGFFDFSAIGSLGSKYTLIHAKVLDYIIEQYGFNIVFLPSNLKSELKYNDLRVSEMIKSRMVHQDKARIITTSTAEQLRSFVRQLNLLIATRMHPSILASIEGIPFISIVYDQKQSGFLNQIGLENCTINVNRLSCQKVISKIEYVLNKKDEITKQMATTIPILKEDLRTKILACLLKFA